MARIPGSVPIAGFIGPTDEGDNYATQSEEWGRGGWRTVADITARNAIFPDRRKIGMVVRVLDAGTGTEKFYTLSGGISDGNWVEQVFGGGASAAEDVTYDHTASGLVAEDVQAAIDEVVETIGDISQPLLFKGAITLPADFPTAILVQIGWMYRVLANVQDSDVTKTHTMQSFLENDEIVWNGTNWTVLGNAGSGEVYTNATPMPVAVGGWDAGSTFSTKSMTAMLDGLLYPYQYPTFSSFTISGQSTPIEVGASIAIDRTFTWGTTNSTNINTNSISLVDVTGGGVTIASGLANDGTEATNYPASPIIKTIADSHSFRIDGVNSKTQTFSRTYSVAWQWMRYYGESGITPLNEAGIKGLRVGGLSSGFAGTYSFVGGGYKYLAYQSSLGTATSFKDQATGLDVPFETPYTVSVTNTNGVTTTYRVHRTTNVLLGSITIIVA